MLLLAFISSESWAQERTVSGKVTSIEDGTALPGVNVVLKGTTTGTVTDVDGNYKLTLPTENGTLIFSFIGLVTEEINVGSRSVIDVQMSADVQQLSEVVVTGYGIERAANSITYQTERVDNEKLLQGQQQVAAAGLTGKVAGLQINVQDNGVNPQTQILLRGLRSISANNEAMIVIDGAVATSAAFNDLNPQDIQSIDVLKGANAGALYGSRAANGAVIVTTKQGKKGDAFSVGWNSSLTFEKVNFMPDFQTTNGTGWDGHYDRIENTNWGPRFDGQPRPIGPSFPDDYPLDDQVVPYAPIKDNLLDFYETGQTFQNTVYASGGDKTGSFYLSVGKTKTEGIMPDDKYDRNTFRVNATKSLGKVKLALSSTYFEDKTDVVGDEIGDQDRPIYWFILNTPANIPLSSYKDWQNPNSYAYADNYYNAYYQNPYWAIGTNRDVDETNRLLANINATYDITDNINIEGRLGVNRSNTIGKEWRAAQTYDDELQGAQGDVASYVEDFEQQFAEYNGNIYLSGDFDLNEDFNLKPIIGASFIDTQLRASRIRAVNLSIPGFYDISNGTGNLAGSVDEEQKRVYGFFADITLGYQNWAFLNFAGRQDYTSTLPQDDNGYFYPAASLSVVLSDALPSITDNTPLSFVKLTASRAIVFNDLGVYDLNEVYFQPREFLMQQGESFFPYGDIAGFEQGNVTVDPNIKKEKLDTWEFGMNVGLFNDRLNIDASYFNTTTTDLITLTTPSSASGALGFRTNIGELSSSGVELTLRGTLLKVRDFAWTFNANYTSYETIVEEIKDGIEEVAIDNYNAYGTYAVVGKAFPQIKAQSYVRDPMGRVVIDQATGNPIVGDVESHGKTTPDYILGFTNQFSWKGITASATIDYRTGHVYFSQGNNSMEFTGRSVESVSANREDFVWPNSVIEVSDGVYEENTDIQISGGRMGFWQNTFNEIKENYVKDATALKVREVAINYSLPKKILSKIGFVNKLTVGFVGRNLWTRLPDQNNFSDPEFRNTRNIDAANGIGIGGYLQPPPTRSLGFNLNVEF